MLRSDSTSSPSRCSVTSARIDDMPARSRGFEQQPGAGEAGAEGGHQDALGQAALDQPLEHEQTVGALILP